MTDKYVVIGNPIAHSKSPQIHALFAAETQQDMSYERLLAPIDGFEATVREFIAAGGRGANVTVPFKEEAWRVATRLTPRAEAAGAVNTLAFNGAEILGDNTDGAGLLADIERNLGVSVVGKRVLLLGAGGAARGVIMPLLERQPAAVMIANRTAPRAEELAQRFPPCRASSYADLGGAFDIVINATSAGLADQALPIAATVFAPGCLAYDMMYGKETPFLRQAREAGAVCADGLGMLVEQAAEAFLVWRGVRPDTAPVFASFRQA